MKKIFILIISLFLFIPTALAYNSNYDKVTDTSLKIYDYGNYLTQEQKDALKGKIDEYISSFNMDIVIVTKKDYDFYKMQYYADDFYDYNGFGIDKVKSGIILFYNVDSEGPAVWMSTTGKAILYYDDARIKRMKSNMSSVKNNGAYAVIRSFINDSFNYAKEGVPESNKYAYIDDNGDYKIDYKKQQQDIIRERKLLRKRQQRSAYGSCTLFGFIVASITIIVFAMKNKKIKKENTANIYLDKGSIKILNIVDQFVGTHTSKRYIPKESSSSGGGSSHHSSSGGSSTWSGSSGTSHGGGGGRL